MKDDAVCIEGLTVAYRQQGVSTTAVEDISFTIERGKTYGLVGESGAGKSTIALTLVGALQSAATVQAQQLRVFGTNVLELRGSSLRNYRIQTIGVVYQEPGSALNPVMRVGDQVAEVYRLSGARRASAWASTIEALASVGLEQPELLAKRYPHELSGGQQQRVVIAMALANEPDLLILDEPTTGLDSQVEEGMFQLIAQKREELQFATLLISHNLPLVAAYCDTVGVLRQGRMVEFAEATQLVAAPQQPYTRELFEAVPNFHVVERKPRDAHAPIVTLEHVRKQYGDKVAVQDANLTIEAGETLGIVGESGSGKSTLGRIIAGASPHEGTVQFQGAQQHRAVQMVFQHPDASLNRRRSVRQTLHRAITLLGGSGTVEELAEQVGIPKRLLNSYPPELSGGEKQRVAIARAFAGNTALVVCDEPTSALDVSIQARVLDLLLELQERTSVAYLFISHDLAVIRRMSHRVAVMKQGRILEVQPVNEFFEHPIHPYSQSLVDSVFRLRSMTEQGAMRQKGNR